MIDLKEARAQLFADLGYKPLNKIWAKVEILLGLVAMSAGIIRMVQEVVHLESWIKTGIPPFIGAILFILGGYLTLAGHRSHMYQAMNDQTAYLLAIIRQLRDKD